MREQRLHHRIGDHGGLPPVVVSMPPELDQPEADDFESRVTATPPGTDVIVDLSSNHFIGSAGVRALVVAKRRIVDSGGCLSLENVPPQAARIFEVTGLTAVFDERSR